MRSRGWRSLVAAAALSIFATACVHEPDSGGVKVKLALPASTYALGNGLSVILHVNHTIPYAHVLMRYRVGSKDDPVGKTGMAHLYEHLMFAGAKHIPPDQFLGTLDRIGATDFNGTTGTDVTSYYETVPAGALEIALFLEAERMAFSPAAFTTAQVDRERRIVREEYRQNYFDRPYGLVGNFARQALLPADHPYFPSPVEWDHDATDITEADLRTFGETYYVPNDATLVITGDFDESAVRPLVEKYFGSIAAGTKAPPSRTIAPPITPQAHETKVAANVDDDRVVLSWFVAADTDDGWREHYLAAALLTDFTGGRLRKKDDILSKTGAHWSIDGGALGVVVSISMTASGPGSVESLFDAFEYTQRWMREDDRLDLGDQQSSIIVRALSDMESPSSRAERLWDLDRRFGNADHVMTDLRAYQSVERARVLRAISETFNPSRAAIVWVKKDPSAPVSGKVVR